MLADTILKRLKEDYDNGMTQQEIADKYHVRQTQISKILIGNRKTAGISVYTFDKMFPRATVSLDGTNVTATDHSNAVVGNNFFSAEKESAESFRNKAIKTLMDIDIPPDALLKVLKALKDLEI